MFTLAHALLMGNTPVSVYGWGLTTNIGATSYPIGSGSAPTATIGLFPDGFANLRLSQIPDQNFRIPGYWLTKLQEDFGAGVEVRATIPHNESMGSYPFWNGVWQSLNVARYYTLAPTNGNQITTSGTILFEFALAGRHDLIQFTQYVDFTLTKV